MEAVIDDGDLELRHGGRVYDTVKAKDIFEEIVNAIWMNGGIGVQFWDTAQRANVTVGLGELVSTNPCGEFWLRDGESCCLSYINLSKVVGNSRVNWPKLELLARLGIQMLDNLIDANKYIPEVPKLEEQAKLTRRVGNGITGLADMLIKMGLVYGSVESIELAGQVMEFILYHSWDESINLARLRGGFPAINKSIFAKNKFAYRKPAPIFGFLRDFGRPFCDWDKLLDRMKEYGVRNCGVTAIPPSSFGSDTMETEGYGCEPIFSASYKRNRKNGDDNWWSQDKSSELQNMPAFIAAHEVSPNSHLLMQAALQRFVTEAISKTVNLPYETTKEEIGRLIIQAWRLGIKGVAFYRAGSRGVEVLECKQCQMVG